MNTIVTIGREYGSAGHEIGRKLAKDLNIPFYDKELLERAAKESGLCREIFENHDEKHTNSFLFSLVMDTYSYGYPSGTMAEMPLNQRVFLAQFDAIRQIAKEGPCVIIGRCADYALENMSNCFSVFIRADLQLRIRRIARLYDLTDAKAKEQIQKTDKSRSSYYNYYTSKKWGDLNSYHLSVASGVLGIDGTVDLLKYAVERKEKGNLLKIFECEPENE